MLLAWLQVRALDGVFIVRMEDLDASRNRPGAADAMLADLQWLGFDWDEGPQVGRPAPDYVQSQRVELYEQCLEILRGRLYRCTCSRKDVREAAGAPHGGELAYPGTCREGTAKEGAAYSLRIRVPEGPVAWDDLWLGPCSDEPASLCGDFIVRAKGGGHVYQLACVADDIAMGITHVLRGADLVASTSRQILLYQWLGAPPPRFAHAPLLRDDDGQRMAKRRGSQTLAELRDSGVHPRELVGLLAQGLGILDRHESVEPSDLIEPFSQRFSHLR